jgi:hypothetical protein
VVCVPYLSMFYEMLQRKNKYEAGCWRMGFCFGYIVGEWLEQVCDIYIVVLCKWLNESLILSCVVGDSVTMYMSKSCTPT